MCYRYLILHKNFKMSECNSVAAEIFVAGSDITKYLCEVCNISFTQRSNLNKHLRKFHQLQFAVQANIICVLCNEKFYKMALLHEHLQNQHSITLNFVNETFYTEKDFLDWKDKIEKESLSRFLMRSSNKDKSNSIINSYYNCHRSGHHEMKQNRIRRLKTSGSIKTGSTCPAFMKVTSETIDGISEIKVHYQSVHLGHDLETRTLQLKKDERENLAACLKLGMSMDKVLEEARRNQSPTNRFRHLTRKHLHNIRKEYGIPLFKEKRRRKRSLQITDVEVSDSSIANDDYVENEESNHAEIQNTAVSSLLLLQNEESNHAEIQEHENNTGVSSLLLLQNEESNHAEIQEHENNTGVTSLLLLQNHNYSEEFNNRKMTIINQLKELQSKIEEWDPLCPLPDVEDHIKAIHARLDFSAPSDRLHVQEMITIFTVSPPDKPTARKRKMTKTKNSPKKKNSTK